MTEFIMPHRAQNSNKGTFGKVLNFAGSKNYIGAAYLSSVAVLKSGAGYVALCTENNIIRFVSTLLPEAVFFSRREGVDNIKNFDVIFVGCGFGQTLTSKRIFRKVVNVSKTFNKTLLIDADGLNILSKLNLELPKDTVITPHPAEAARLLGTGVENIVANLEDSARELCKKYNCVTALKTHRTIICNQSGEIYVNKHGNSALAKAGTGDVLAGIIAGLLAQKMNSYEAAKLGVYIHSCAGELASEDLTEYSVLASELIKYIPLAIKEMI